MNERLVLLKNCYAPYEAHIIQSALKNEGISSFIMDNHLNSVAWHLQIATGGTRLMIMEEDYERAISVLKNQSKNKKEIIKQKENSIFLKILQIIISFLAGVPFIFRKRSK